MEKSVKTRQIKSKVVRPESGVTEEARAYADGTSLDRVQYLEAKLILKPDRFTSVQSFRDFGKIVRRTAKRLGVDFVERQGRSKARNQGDHLSRYA